MKVEKMHLPKVHNQQLRFAFGTVLVLLFSVCSNAQIDTTDITISGTLPSIEVSSSRGLESNEVLISRQQLLNYPASFDDPARVLLKYPGVSNHNDQANFVSYQGLPSYYHKWRLYGASALNPNHQNNAGTLNDLPTFSSGGVNMLSGQVVGALEFHGNPSCNASDVIGAVSDIKLRTPYKNNITTNFSLIGLEAGVDHVSNDGRHNLMLNYRYSFVGLLTGLGLDFGGERIDYQDLTAKYGVKLKNGGSLSIYGALGYDNNNKDTLVSDEPALFKKDREYIHYEGRTILGGIHYNRKTASGNQIAHTINYSRKDISRINYDADFTLLRPIEIFNARAYLIASMHEYKKVFSNKSYLRISIRPEYNNFYTKRSTISVGVGARAFSILPKIGYHLKFAKRYEFGIESGYLFTETASDYLNFVGNFYLGYKHNDFAVRLSAGSSVQDLSLPLVFATNGIDHKVANSGHVALTFQYKGFGASIFAHQLFDSFGISESRYSLFEYDANVMGFSLFANKRILGFDTNINLSNFDTADQNSHAGSYDFDYLINATVMKQWKLSNDKKLGFGVALTSHSGLFLPTIDLEQSRSNNKTFFSRTAAPYQGNPYTRMDLRIYYQPSKRSTISLDIQNVTNNINDGNAYYEPLQDKIIQKEQLGILPVLSYKREFGY